ncbi:conserved hypothetical protein [Ricinus communis]|uniref:Endonuclease/exonuclease/phosphatase domain-containing protein n=1 Tax=Ricinus communis TaxID=3988 RepID=B9RQ39_RICCO|nr:conserved hypothetical protein [Ricinus communis]
MEKSKVMERIKTIKKSSCSTNDREAYQGSMGKKKWKRKAGKSKGFVIEEILDGQNGEEMFEESYSENAPMASLKPSIFKTFCYGEPTKEFREEVWKRISSLKPPPHSSLVCVGDFSSIVSPSEKKGGRRPDDKQLQLFSDFVNRNELIDVGFKGTMYTWSNKQLGDKCVMERLDRALASLEWRCQFPNAQIIHEYMLGSDHHPLVLMEQAGSFSKKRLFRFEEKWKLRDRCKEVVEDCWMEHQREDSGWNCVTKLQQCKEGLISWAKRE